MSQRDRSNQDRGLEEEPRRDPRGSDRTPDQPVRRRGMSDYDDDSFDLPAWGTQRQSTTTRGGGRQNSPQPPRQPRREPTSRGGARKDPLPTLGDAFRRPSRRQEPDADDSSPSSTRDPYDRLRSVAARPQRPVDVDDGEDVETSYFGGYETEDYEDLPPVPREQLPREQRVRRRPTGPVVERHPAAPRTPATQQISGLIAAAGPQTRLIAGVGGFAVVSLVLMAATLAGRMSALPEWLPIHLNAEGRPDFWGTTATLWRVPLMALMLTLMSFSVAWYLWRRDPFAARFTLATTVLIHALCWVALINLVW